MSFLLDLLGDTLEDELGDPISDFLDEAFRDPSPILSETDMGDWLYARIPPATRARDGFLGFPLRQLLRVSAVAFYGLHSSVQDLLLVVDADRCAASLLPQLGNMLGFEFPFDLTEAQQRAFIKFMVSIYRVKGTSTSLRAVARRLIGNGFDLTVSNENVAAHTFDIAVTANSSGGLAAELQTKLEYVLNSVTPAGLIPTLTIAFFFDEVLPAGFVDSEIPRTDFVLSSWKCNVKTHKINNNIVLNQFATIQLV